MDILEGALEEQGLLEQKSFESEMNDPVIVIDKTHIPVEIWHRFSLWIENTCGSTLYFKIVEQLPNWILLSTPDIPPDGKLGAIAAGASKHFVGLIRSPLPAGERTDVGNFVVEAYPDDTYTALIESHSHPTTIYIEDLENWANVQKSDFDDGTSQGWTLSAASISSDRSIAEGGYSVLGRISTYGTGAINRYPYLKKAVSLPNTDRVRLSFYIYWWGQTNVWAPGFNHTGIRDVAVHVNDGLVFSMLKPGEWWVYLSRGFGHGLPVVHRGWFKCGVDLSDYRGQTVDIKISANLYVYQTEDGRINRSYFYVDDVVIAGK